MDTGSVKLLNDDGTFRCFITCGEASRRTRNKEMRRVRLAHSPKSVYQLIKYPNPSSSARDNTSISARDLRLVIGVQRLCDPYSDLKRDKEQKDLERLIGFGLLPENTPMPKHGYLGQ